MTLPEDQIAALQIRALDRMSDRLGLHVGIARYRSPGHLHRELDETGAVDAEAAPPTPEIGRLQKPAGDCDMVAWRRIFESPQMIEDDGLAGIGHAEPCPPCLRLANDPDLAAHRQGSADRGFQYPLPDRRSFAALSPHGSECRWA
jgi:hypothetical protein